MKFLLVSVMDLIGICGRKESGKSLLSSVLVEKYGYIRFTFDNALKNLICSMLNIDRTELEKVKNNGLTLDFTPTEEIMQMVSKETNISIVNIKDFFDQNTSFTMRELLQKIGTNLIRKFNENWHVNKVRDSILNLIKNDSDAKIVVDDVRFQNEIKMLNGFKANLFFIIRPSNFNVSNHESDISVLWNDMCIPFENIIINDCTQEALTYEWENYINNGTKNVKYNVFNSKDKTYDGNYYAFSYDLEPSEKELFLAGYILSQKDDFSFNCLNENGISIKTNNKFIKDIALNVLRCDYRIVDGNYIIELYNPFIMENLKVAMNY